MISSHQLNQPSGVTLSSSGCDVTKKTTGKKPSAASPKLEEAKHKHRDSNMKQTSDVLHCLYTARFFFFTYCGNKNKDQLHMWFPLCPLNQHMSLTDLPSPSHMALIRAEAAQRLHSATSARPVLPHSSAAHL